MKKDILPPMKDLATELRKLEMTIEGIIETARVVQTVTGDKYLYCTTKGRKFITNEESLIKLVLDNVGMYGIFVYTFFHLGGLKGSAGAPNTYYLKDWSKR